MRGRAATEWVVGPFPALGKKSLGRGWRKIIGDLGFGFVDILMPLRPQSAGPSRLPGGSESQEGHLKGTWDIYHYYSSLSGPALLSELVLKLVSDSQAGPCPPLGCRTQDPPTSGLTASQVCQTHHCFTCWVGPSPGGPTSPLPSKTPAQMPPPLWSLP